MNKFHKLLIITSVIGSIFGWNISVTQAQSNLSQSECKNDSSFKTAYDSGWSDGFNLGKPNNSYQGENRSRCYNMGFSDGLMTSAKRDSDENSLYISCLASRLNNPSRVCQEPKIKF
ncbi:hypothetical protein [Dolichospermum circinale]|uniref:hypothetical protein n=1 Tax=Dolichospermum circinale TaxID=109265 RepID=UPI0004843DAC|nr:hypothetical protein [Dolichospermum circinale]MDB9473254.1 hypothetical protein [Dolichospermum circinale CS-537/11]MDB9483759.1 hypothetical protein [Dolichospermum circinale CS-537/05]MDB9546526.1 hypothetical protein [Dolichospermum circinale CS-1031]